MEKRHWVLTLPPKANEMHALQQVALKRNAVTMDQCAKENVTPMSQRITKKAKLEGKNLALLKDRPILKDILANR